MKIAIIGYGKMGQEIEKLAVERGHEISIKIGLNANDAFNSEAFIQSDVAIEFTQPESAVDNYKRCFEHGVPVVSGTTGWLDQFEEITALCEKEDHGFFYASNFSVGVNIFFEINKKLAQLINPTQAYEVSMEETHHTQKLDAPSGTAITLAEQILQEIDIKEQWSLGSDSESELDSDLEHELSIEAHRIADTPGTHKIKYSSEVDEITIEHRAKNRKGFVMGAVLAAEFMQGKSNVYGMQDLLKF